MSTALTTLAGISKALASIKTLDEAVNLRDQAAAIRHYAKESHQSLEIQNRAAYVKLQCERKGGELLLETPKLGHRQKKGTTLVTFSETLEKAGVPGETARRWQSLARWPERDLTKLLASCIKDETELTTGLAVWSARAYLASRKEKAEQKALWDARAEQRAVRTQRSNGSDREIETHEAGTADDETHEVMRLEPPNEQADREEQELYRLRELLEEARQLCEPRPRLQAWAKTLRGWEAKLDYWIAPRICSTRPTTEKET